MKLTAKNLVAWHDLTSPQYVQKRDEFAKKDFRTIALALYGAPSSPHYAAVMVKRPKVIATRSVVDLCSAGYQKAFDEMADEGFGPYIITATGPVDGALFAGVFRKIAKIPLTRHNLSQAEFIELNNAQKDAGNILV